jgi:hypothetical protein
LENRYAEKFGVRRPLKEVEAAYYAGEPTAVADVRVTLSVQCQRRLGSTICIYDLGLP